MHELLKWVLIILIANFSLMAIYGLAIIGLGVNIVGALVKLIEELEKTGEVTRLEPGTTMAGTAAKLSPPLLNK